MTRKGLGHDGTWSPSAVVPARPKPGLCVAACTASETREAVVGLATVRNAEQHVVKAASVATELSHLQGRRNASCNINMRNKQHRACAHILQRQRRLAGCRESALQAEEPGLQTSGNTFKSQDPGGALAGKAWLSISGPALQSSGGCKRDPSLQRDIQLGGLDEEAQNGLDMRSHGMVAELHDFHYGVSEYFRGPF